MTGPDNSADIEAAIAAAAFCARRGWVPATSGNFSVRTGAGRMAITASGRDKGALTADDFIDVDLAGALPAGVSAEAPLHAALYARDGAIGAVFHVHSLAATLASQRHLAAGFIAFEGYEMLKALAGIATHAARVVLPVFANDQDIAALAARIAPHLQDGPGRVGYLLAGHGLYAWGNSPAEARRHVEAIDFLLNCELEKERLSQ